MANNIAALLTTATNEDLAFLDVLVASSDKVDQNNKVEAMIDFLFRSISARELDSDCYSRISPLIIESVVSVSGVVAESEKELIRKTIRQVCEISFQQQEDMTTLYDYANLLESSISNPPANQTKEDLSDAKKELKATTKKIQYNTFIAQITQSLVKMMVSQNMGYVASVDKIYREMPQRSMRDIKFITCTESALAKQYPSIFEPSVEMREAGITAAEILTQFRKIREDIGRSYNNTGLSFRDLPPDVMNTIGNRKFWLKPIFGEKHDEFFDILFDTVFPDPLCKKNVLDCLAFKYTFPQITRLPCPVIAGVGGVGRTGMQKIFETIFGKPAVDWSVEMNEDLMKFNSALQGKVIVCFDDINPVKPDSPEYAYFKKIIHNEDISIRVMREDRVVVDNTAWIWIPGNPKKSDTADVKSPVPLVGGEASGVDRRWTVSVVKESLITVVMRRLSKTKEEAEAWVSHHFNTTAGDEVEIAKWLGNVITDSGVQSKTINDHPRCYHGPAYKLLLGYTSDAVIDVFWYIFGQKDLKWVSLADAYLTYTTHCEMEGNKFIKSKNTFRADIDELLSNHFPGLWSNKIHGVFKPGVLVNDKPRATTCVGWKLDSLRKKPLLVTAKWLDTSNVGQVIIDPPIMPHNMAVDLCDEDDGSEYKLSDKEFIRNSLQTKK